MNIWAETSFSVTKTNNGWVVEWKDERLEKERRRERERGYSTFPMTEVRTRGVEVFTDKKALMKRIEQLI